jgi:hypothetical protein
VHLVEELCQLELTESHGGALSAGTHGLSSSGHTFM